MAVSQVGRAAWTTAWHTWDSCHSAMSVGQPVRQVGTVRFFSFFSFSRQMLRLWSAQDCSCCIRGSRSSRSDSLECTLAHLFFVLVCSMFICFRVPARY